MRHAHPRLKIQNGEYEGVDRAVPPDHVEGRGLGGEGVKHVAAFDHRFANALVDRAHEGRLAKITVAIRSVHSQLAHPVSPLGGDVHAPATLDPEPVLGKAGGRHEPVQRNSLSPMVARDRILNLPLPSRVIVAPRSRD